MFVLAFVSTERTRKASGESPMAKPAPPPEAVLIAGRRESPPRMSMSEAARRAGISDTRWRQIEKGSRPFRGGYYPEAAPAELLARMAQVVGVTAEELAACGRADAAAELAALPPLAADPDRPPTWDDFRRQQAQMERLETLVEQFIEAQGKQEKEGKPDEGTGRRRQAG